VPTERSKAIARAIAESMGRRPTIVSWESDHFPGLKVAILYAEAWPEADRNTAVTLDLGDDPVPSRERQYELYIVANRGWEIEQIVGDVGIRVRRGSIVPEPGEFIINGMMPSYEDTRVRHLIAIDPPTVPLLAEPPEVEPPVGFLQLVPFSDGEREVLESQGKDALMDMLRGRGTDLLDFGRD
jgi:hypothetical protein